MQCSPSDMSDASHPPLSRDLRQVRISRGLMPSLRPRARGESTTGGGTPRRRGDSARFAPASVAATGDKSGKRNGRRKFDAMITFMVQPNASVALEAVSARNGRSSRIDNNGQFRMCRVFSKDECGQIVKSVPDLR